MTAFNELLKYKSENNAYNKLIKDFNKNLIIIKLAKFSYFVVNSDVIKHLDKKLANIINNFFPNLFSTMLALYLPFTMKSSSFEDLFLLSRGRSFRNLPFVTRNGSSKELLLVVKTGNYGHLLFITKIKDFKDIFLIVKSEISGNFPCAAKTKSYRNLLFVSKNKSFVNQYPTTLFMYLILSSNNSNYLTTFINNILIYI